VNGWAHHKQRVVRMQGTGKIAEMFRETWVRRGSTNSHPPEKQVGTSAKVPSETAGAEVQTALAK